MLNKPEIGSRVKYAGSAAIGACVGTVIKLSPDFEPRLPYRELPFTPEGWHVVVDVEPLPDRWPYTGRTRFAPPIAAIEPT